MGADKYSNVGSFEEMAAMEDADGVNETTDENTSETVEETKEKATDTVEETVEETPTEETETEGGE